METDKFLCSMETDKFYDKFYYNYVVWKLLLASKFIPFITINPTHIVIPTNKFIVQFYLFISM